MTNAGLRVTEIKETPSAEKANELLKSGWVFRGIASADGKEKGEKAHFLYCIVRTEA